MGCCFSSEDETKYQDQDVNERTRLLQDPVSESTRQVHSTFPSNTPPPAQKGDEQSALNRILHQTANDVIDVSAIDSHGMEQHEYMDRARQYSTRLAIVCNNSQRLKTTAVLPNGITSPQATLSAQPLSIADIQLITQAAETAAAALGQVKVTHKEDLVVPFGVP